MVVGGSRGLEKTGLVHLRGRLSHPAPEVQRLLIRAERWTRG